MDFLNHNHIKVTKRLTIDGTNLKVNEDGTVATKTWHLPRSAKAHLVKRNLDLPKNLKMVIEDVNVTAAPSAPSFEAIDAILKQADAHKAAASDKDKEIADLKAQLEKLKTPEIAPKPAPKGGNKIPPAPVTTAFVNTNLSADDIN